MNVKRISSNLFRRLTIYFAGLIIYAFGACLSVRANTGISPITSVAYILNDITPLSLGMTLFLVNIILVLLQVLILRKEFSKFQYLQIVTSVFFSVFIDMIMPFTVAFASSLFVIRYIILFGSILVMAMGITMMSVAEIVMLPGDGLPKVAAKLTRWPFGKAKVLSDCFCVMLTIIISLIALGRVECIKAGTAITALSVGNVVRLIMYYMNNPLAVYINGRVKCCNRVG